MAAEPAIRVKYDDDDMVVRIRRGALSGDRVSRFLDYIQLEEIREKSEMTEEQAAEIADEIDRAMWERVRARYEGE